MMFLTGEPDREWQKAGGSVADSNLSLHAGMALLAAVNARHRDGRGQFVDVSLFDSMLAALGYIGQLALLTGNNFVEHLLPNRVRRFHLFTQRSMPATNHHHNLTP